MEWIHILAGPIIGAVIGYFTNYLAVKMLFRPLNPIKIGTYTLPFTPGIIPKGKHRLARALGNAVGDTLLTKRDMEEALLSDEVKQMVKDAVTTGISQDEETIQGHMKGWMEEGEIEKWNGWLTDKITKKIVDSLQKMQIGDLIVEEGSKIIKEKTSGTFLGMMVNDSLIQSIAKPVGAEAEKYVREHGEEKIAPIIEKELENMEGKKIEELLQEFGTDAEKIGKMAESAYEEIIRRKGEEMLGKVHISEIVESKVEEMDVMELEKLLLSIMKKELNTVVGLGAVIGFVIGCVNLFL